MLHPWPDKHPWLFYRHPKAHPSPVSFLVQCRTQFLVLIPVGFHDVSFDPKVITTLRTFLNLHPCLGTPAIPIQRTESQNIPRYCITLSMIFFSYLLRIDYQSCEQGCECLTPTLNPRSLPTCPDGRQPHTAHEALLNCFPFLEQPAARCTGHAYRWNPPSLVQME
jgi:hypothetical protein